MKLKKGELRVYYNIEGTNYHLDSDIEKGLKKYGYVRWASGQDLKTGVRDICFDKKRDSESLLN